MASPRLLLVLLALVACTSEPDGTTTGSSSGTTAAGSSSSTGDPTTGEPTTSADGCASHPPGEWAACFVGGMTNNSLCGWTEGAGNGTVTCLSPQSGSFNVCGIRDCVDDCDCFAAPATGTAVPSCEVVTGGGDRACVLYCVNGQTCPDGMTCKAGTCYWPS